MSLLPPSITCPGCAEECRAEEHTNDCEGDIHETGRWLIQFSALLLGALIEGCLEGTSAQARGKICGAMFGKWMLGNILFMFFSAVTRRT